jgi:hypothetical protein
LLLTNKCRNPINFKFFKVRYQECIIPTNSTEQELTPYE